MVVRRASSRCVAPTSSNCEDTYAALQTAPGSDVSRLSSACSSCSRLSWPSSRGSCASRLPATWSSRMLLSRPTVAGNTARLQLLSTTHVRLCHRGNSVVSQICF